jgi:hypothetical protein
VCVPSSFFIGDSGIPLEVIAGSISADELVTRIHKVRQVRRNRIGSLYKHWKMICQELDIGIFLESL